MPEHEKRECRRRKKIAPGNVRSERRRMRADHEEDDNSDRQRAGQCGESQAIGSYCLSTIECVRTPFEAYIQIRMETPPPL